MRAASGQFGCAALRTENLGEVGSTRGWGSRRQLGSPTALTHWASTLAKASVFALRGDFPVGVMLAAVLFVPLV